MDQAEASSVYGDTAEFNAIWHATDNVKSHASMASTVVETDPWIRVPLPRPRSDKVVSVTITYRSDALWLSARAMEHNVNLGSVSAGQTGFTGGSQGLIVGLGRYNSSTEVECLMNTYGYRTNGVLDASTSNSGIP